MQTARKSRVVQMPDRLCYSCNEGCCAYCSGWDRTVVNGEVVLVPCTHDCRTGKRKPVESAYRYTLRAKLKG